VIYYFKCPSCS